MIKRRLLRAAVIVTAGIAVGVGSLAAGGAWSSAPVPVLAAVTLPTTLVAHTPCTATARACVDLTTKHAWLIRNGGILAGPVPINIGGPGELTPTGTFTVWRKDPHHVSVQQHGTPMPYSVFFDRGVAFHSGPLALMSAGCVHLRLSDAMTFYRNLRLGDQVQVRATPPRPRPFPARPVPAQPVAARPVPAQPVAARPVPARPTPPVTAPGVRVLPPAAVTGQTRRPVVPVQRQAP